MQSPRSKAMSPVWIRMKGLRNVLAHEYFGVDVDILWQTIQEDLPALKAALANMGSCASPTEPSA